MSSKETADAFYTKYPLEQHDYPDRFNKIASLCSGRVLDIGCGTGTLTKYWPGAYHGVDISSVAIDKAIEARRTDTLFKVGDVTKHWEAPSGNYDTIVLAEFLEHIPDDTEVFDHLEAWSKIGTKWVISVPNAGRVKDPDHVREFTVPELRRKLAKYGQVSFHPWSGFAARIICTVDVGVFREPYITLAMMCWNEGKGLERAIVSALGLVDEVIVSVDTKTTDNTRDIALQYADVVKEHKWANDFSAARNSTHAGAKGAWILSLDGHEYIEQHPDIIGKLPEKYDGFLLKIVMENDASFFYPRLYKKGLQYKNRVHNLIQTTNPLSMAEFVIKHDRDGGLAPEQRQARLKQRNRMMPWIFTWNLLKNPGDLRSRYYLARHCQDRKKFRAALRHYRLYLEKYTDPKEAYQAAYQAHVCCVNLNEIKRAFEFLDLAENIAPMRWETYKRKGMLYLTLCNWAQAIVNLSAALNESPQKVFDSPEPRNDGQTLERLGFAFYQVGYYEQAREVWEKALEQDIPEPMKDLIHKRIKFISARIANK